MDGLKIFILFSSWTTTVAFATSRASLKNKLIGLKNCTDSVGMEFHPSKSQFLAVGFSHKSPFLMGNIHIYHTDQYTYLGTPIANTSISNQVQSHANLKAGQVIKCVSFLKKEQECTLHAKKTVWEGAINLTILYGCQTYLGASMLSVKGFQTFMGSIHGSSLKLKFKTTQKFSRSQEITQTTTAKTI